MSNVIPFKTKTNSLDDAMKSFAFAVFKSRPSDFEECYTYTETVLGRVNKQQISPIKYLCFLTEVCFIEPLIDQVEEYEMAALEALTKAVDCGRLTLEGEALYQSVLSVSREMAEPAGGAEHETN
ncbi:hypothetical protein EKQ45_08060 [Proteus vulgaris]|uniref:hypothetical protein n=1 Tax=Proteus mirabilis TaxID=584 RepID=UPI001373CBA2|nr:hypothetical protein [Proteus mirabilis]QHP75910.1 hypothetical protein EKQ45_08060 [Proteus vulgaris]QIM25750.1 hypothetical protein G9Q98_13460 [Proteus mirabilis]